MTGQQEFSAALVDPTLPVPAGLVSPRRTPDTRRFAVYRNNVHVSLVGALAARFPVTRQVVGEDFFTGMARVYVGGAKPDSPVLLGYGDSFPAFIAGFPPARTIGFLPDLARLEAAWSHSYNAADHTALAPADLAKFQPDILLSLRLFLAPATRLVRSHWPIGSIWSAHQQSPFVPPTARDDEAVLLTRPEADVRLTIIPPAAAALLDALDEAESLGAALETALAAHPDLDPGAILVGLAGLGAFAALSQE